MKNEKFNILIVDDSLPQLVLLQEVLKSNNYNIDTATTGKIALDIINKKSLDLILLDIMLPDISGFKLLNILNQNPKTTNIPVIMISAKNESSSIKKTLEMGAMDYIVKPINPDILNAKVKNIITHYKYI
ncbi:MAG: response regulator [Bacteroidales bacterium]|nr:response regulator [Bacteroidales bacterium]